MQRFVEAILPYVLGLFCMLVYVLFVTSVIYFIANGFFATYLGIFYISKERAFCYGFGVSVIFWLIDWYKSRR